MSEKLSQETAKGLNEQPHARQLGDGFLHQNRLTPLLSWPQLGEMSENLPPASSVWLGIFAVRQDLGLVGANQTAISMASEADGIQLRDGRLQFHDRLSGLRLQREVAQAAASPHRCAMSVPRPSARRPYAVLVATASRTAGGDAALAAIVVADTTRRVRLNANAARDVFGLSLAEIELANCLANGDELRVAASNIGISYNTARSQLASIFRKTDTARQAELVKVLLTGLVAF